MSYFNESEFSCPCCDASGMDETFMERLNAIRHCCGFPFIITSGYRCEKHNRQIGGAPGSAHLDGQAADIYLRGDEALMVVSIAKQFGFNGIGVSQKGKDRFIHLDTKGEHMRFWSY